jgi:hypothetical protein
MLEETIMEMDERSILDFGRARPGEEKDTPTIVLTIPITSGETNKYVNFMRMAEDQYGWDALHPRLAANRDRKARIALAAASLEKVESGRESGDEMSVDLSDGEGSNPDNGGVSGADAQAKPKKKRNFKEDQYDVDDDFVDDSELLWEAQAAASRDGFFVYSGPLVPEVEKPAAGYVSYFILVGLFSGSLTYKLQTGRTSQAWTRRKRKSRRRPRRSDTRRSDSWTRWRPRLPRRRRYKKTSHYKIREGAARAGKSREGEHGQGVSYRIPPPTDNTVIISPRTWFLEGGVDDKGRLWHLRTHNVVTFQKLFSSFFFSF